MALQSAFRERLEQMESTRNERINLLQLEKELQTIKSRDLASKLSNIRSIEQRCLKLDCKIASQNLIISSLRSELHCLDSVYAENFQKIRTLKLEVEELEVLDKEKESYYKLQSQELVEFKAEVDSHIGNSQLQIHELRTQANELKSSFSNLQGSLNYSTNSEISPAETKRAELLAEKESMDKILASNYEVRDRLRKQLQNILTDQRQKEKAMNAT